MEHKTVTNELKMLSAEEISKRGWKIPSIGQFSKNMEDRLKKVRGEEDRLLSQHPPPRDRLVLRPPLLLRLAHMGI